MREDTDRSVQGRLQVVGPDSVAEGVAGWARETVASLAEVAAGTVPASVVVVHEATLRAHGEWTGFPAWLRRFDARANAVILAHEGLSVAELVECFRAGLADALPSSSPPAQWDAALGRVGRRLALQAEARAVKVDAAATQRLLQDGRRRLRHEAAAETAALLQAQADLEAANRRLGDHMAQVSLLYKFGRELSLASNWDDTLREILAHLAEFVGAAGGALVLRAAPGGAYAPRQTYRWQEQSWDKVLLRITRQIDAGVASSLLAPGIFQVGPQEDETTGGRITALPLEHQGIRLGMLLLLFGDPDERRQRSAANLPFLQMVQVVVSEEVASAQMLDRLRDIGAFNTRVLETVSSAIWVCAQGHTIFVNRAARTLLGLDAGPVCEDAAAALAVGRGRLLDRPLTGGAEIDDLPELFLDGALSVAGRQAPLFAGLQRRKRPFRGEGLVRDLRGRAIPVRVQTAPMAGRGRDERWLLVILEDLREVKRAEAARRRAERAEALVAMSATLAHEIRNPLMGLSAQAELLADSLPVDDSRRDRIDLITSEVERINHTIADMLQFVRPCDLRREAVDPVRLARVSLDLARPRAETRGVSLRVLADAPVEINADSAKLKQVLLNLVLNAVDAAPTGGTVTVRLSGDRSLAVPDPTRGSLQTVPAVAIAVEDDGAGFAGIEPERLFEPFFTTKTTGTGLGLAYSRKVVDAHGGEIRAERDGAITRMLVLLPREAVAGKTLAGEAT
ncbi:MAG TPA: ATP-binding protein [Candidatus Krumholzibacteria bacterium]|nr:ATP-binding protein [Candidatus Krumholzibacteria bacterium]HPD71639.1 ATP-binding protein [Candidatus Krumholzibacteria bacterium]HRY41428.1 ATP-binding protein [Candidatus Krumholzibacteria bacterium]